MLLLGIDVSHHQKPSLCNWRQIRDTQSFCISRASYGVKPDEAFVRHFTGARDAGLTVGGYTFFRQSEPWQKQYEVFADQLNRVRYGVGHIVPVVDLEWNDSYDGPVHPGKLNDGAQALMQRLMSDYGGCMAYLSPSFYEVLGKPKWLLLYPWWIAHYTKAVEPACPYKKDWTIWQYTSVGQVPGYSGPLDLNRAYGLPLVAEARRTSLLPVELDQGEMRRDRDAWIRGKNK